MYIRKVFIYFCIVGAIALVVGFISNWRTKSVLIKGSSAAKHCDKTLGGVYTKHDSTDMYVCYIATDIDMATALKSVAMAEGCVKSLNKCAGHLEESVDSHKVTTDTLVMCVDGWTKDKAALDRLSQGQSL